MDCDRTTWLTWQVFLSILQDFPPICTVALHSGALHSLAHNTQNLFYILKCYVVITTARIQGSLAKLTPAPGQLRAQMRDRFAHDALLLTRARKLISRAIQCEGSSGNGFSQEQARFPIARRHEINAPCTSMRVGEEIPPRVRYEAEAHAFSLRPGLVEAHTPASAVACSRGLCHARPTSLVQQEQFRIEPRRGSLDNNRACSPVRLLDCLPARYIFLLC